MGKHIVTSPVLVCTLSTRHEGIVLQLPHSRISFARPPVLTRKVQRKLF